MVKQKIQDKEGIHIYTGQGGHSDLERKQAKEAEDTGRIILFVLYLLLNYIEKKKNDVFFIEGRHVYGWWK